MNGKSGCSFAAAPASGALLPWLLVLGAFVRRRRR
jgi:MYXO-CTERM domain-containing protein